jgi:hypothetical protein
MGEAEETTQDRWARLRFSVVGPLLAAPPPQGELAAELERLAGKVWRHPTTSEPVRFARSTLERWYYAARREPRDPVAVLRRRVRKDAGQAWPAGNGRWENRARSRLLTRRHAQPAVRNEPKNAPRTRQLTAQLTAGRRLKNPEKSGRAFERPGHLLRHRGDQTQIVPARGIGHALALFPGLKCGKRNAISFGERSLRKTRGLAGLLRERGDPGTRGPGVVEIFVDVLPGVELPVEILSADLLHIA